MATTLFHVPSALQTSKRFMERGWDKEPMEWTVHIGSINNPTWAKTVDGSTRSWKGLRPKRVAGDIASTRNVFR